MHPSENSIFALIRDEFGVEIAGLEELHQGEDFHARTFKVAPKGGGQTYFLKLRTEPVHSAALAIPHFLFAHGVPLALAPLPALSGDLSVDYEDMQIILYPFIPGENAAFTGLSLGQWNELGRAVRAWHDLALPADLACQVERESFSSVQRDLAVCHLRRAVAGEFDHGTGQTLAAVLRANRYEIDGAIQRAEALASGLSTANQPFVLCHNDLTPWNILVQPDGHIRVVDWDSPRLARRECDLMFIGGNLTGRPDDAAAVKTFYQGYGEIVVDPATLAFYRYERVLMDLVAFSQEAWEHPGMSPERCDIIAGYVAGNFAPGGPLDAARRADPVKLGNVRPLFIGL